MGEKPGSITDLSAQDLIAMFCDQSKFVRLEAGEVLFKNGDPGTSMYVVRSGALTIRSGAVIYEHVGPGGIVGEMGIVEACSPRTAMVYARSPAELIEIDEPRFLSLVRETPSFALTVMRVLSRRLRRMDVRYETSHDADFHA
jgi:CRP/FNR family transcriptional regulator, cyclic AMP receptor protein